MQEIYILKGIVKWAEPCKYIILLVSKRYTLTENQSFFKRMGILIFDTCRSLSTIISPFKFRQRHSSKAAYLHRKNILLVSRICTLTENQSFFKRMEILIFDTYRPLSTIISPFKFSQRYSSEGCLFTSEKLWRRVLEANKFLWEAILWK